MICPNCNIGQGTFEENYNRDRRYGKALNYFRCTTCGIVFHNEPTPEDWYSSGAYRKHVHPHPWQRQGYGLVQIKKRALNQAVWLRNLGAFKDVETALDIGAQDGLLVKLLNEWGLLAEGFDLDVLTAAQSPWVTSDPTKLRNKYHLLTMSHVLEHVPSPMEFLIQWSSYIEHWLFIEVPQTKGYPHRFVFDNSSLSRTISLALPRHKTIQTMEIGDCLRALLEF